MARSSIQKFDQRAQIAGTPDYVVGGGELAATLTALGGGVAGRLKQMADRAAASEGEMAGMNAGQVAGAGFLERQASQGAAATAAGVVPPRKLNTSIDMAIAQAAQKHGVSADTLRLIASIESSGDPNAQNPVSSAGGLFQFVDATAADYGLTNRFDVGQASDAAARLLKDNAAHLARVLGRTATPAELYLAHQQGAGGAAKLLSNPGARAADIVGMDAVTKNGGSAGMTAGQFAGLWLGKAGGSAPASLPAPEAPATGGLNPQPLALRRDNTIYGGAFDAAAIRTYGWRMQEGVSNAVTAAYDQHKDDPAAFAAALGGIRDQFSQDENFGDPELRDLFDKTFAERTRTYTTAVTQRHEARLMEEQAASFGAGVDAMRGDLEKQAFLLGANPEADAILAGQSAVLLNNIAAAEAANVISPSAAAAEREQVNTTLAYARTNGVFASLPTPEAKRTFANALLTDWANGEGPLTELGYTQVKALADQLSAQALQAQNTLTAESKAELARVQGLIQADVASIAATGVPLDTAANDLQPDRLKVLGIDTAEWQAQRDRARQGWEATAGMELETPAELNDRLMALQPVPGSPDFVRQSEVYGQAVERAQAVLKERETDPLGQAQRAGAVALKPIDMSSPEALASSLTLRAQEGNAVAAMYGTPASYFRPEERTAIANALLDNPQMLPGFAVSVSEAFGDGAARALGELSDAGPELAHAAGITLATGDASVATEMARVLAGRRDKTINVKLPSDAVMSTAAASIIGPAIGQNPATAAAVKNVAGMLFEAQAAAMGFDPADIKEPGSAAFAAYQHAINRALGATQVNGQQYGGLTQVNGQQIVAPTQMAAGSVEQLLHSMRPADLAALPPISSANGVPIAAGDLAGGKLLTIGDGQYAIALGDPNSLTPSLVLGADGQPWTLDMYELERLRNAPQVGGSYGGVGRPSPLAVP